MNTLFSIYSVFLGNFPGEFKLLGDIIPIWFFWIIPLCWPIIILVSTVFYSILMYIFMLCLKIDNPLKKLRKIVIRMTFLGFLCDLIFGGFLFVLELVVENVISKADFFYWYKNFFLGAFNSNPYKLIFSVLTMCIPMVLSRILNYKLNKKYTFSKLDIDDEKKKKLALAIAIFTAPYIFFFPFYF